MSVHYDLLIVGAGPAGIAAAVRAAQHHHRVLMIDDNADIGGQIWRADIARSSLRATVQCDHPGLRPWRAALNTSAVELWSGARLLARESGHYLILRNDHIVNVQAKNVLLCCGAREKFLPFAGWTLPGVNGLGGLQALAKGGWPVAGKRVVLAGSGPLLLSVASTLREHGADVICIAEQSRWRDWLLFACGLWRFPSKCWQAIGLLLPTLRALLMAPLSLTANRTRLRMHANCVLIQAHGGQKLSAVTLRNATREWQIDCDLLACAYGLLANTESASLLGCDLKNGFVQVDEMQRTSVANIFAAGEMTGIGGVDKALIEGEIAALTITGQLPAARRLLARRNRWQGFAGRLQLCFAWRHTLHSIVRDNSIICRCEDVTYSPLRACVDGRSARLYTRAGMGACQGRVCGPICEQLFAWSPVSTRPPLQPFLVSSLLNDPNTLNKETP